ncbi:MAG: Uma2 family endonuclease [Labilithrix sp.]|nr:Uma2 family endonuclease [Labilithrix sp.]
MAGAAKRLATYAEYVAGEAGATIKHEYVGGRILAMAGGSVEHGRLVTRLTVLLSAALAGRPCVVLPADVRVRIRAADRATYPDVHVICGQVERDPDDEHAVVNPVVIIEVLSDSTAETDRGDELADYRRLRSLREYVLVSQRERRVDVYRRDGRRWVLDEHLRGERARLEALDVTLDVDDLYVDGLGAIVS